MNAVATKQTITTVVTKIAFEDIDKTYNGEQGCACGCGGDYIEPAVNPELVAKHLARINARIKSNPEGVDVEYSYASIEGVKKALRVYFKDSVSYSYSMTNGQLERTETVETN